jgi:hypothetical protein
MESLQDTVAAAATKARAKEPIALLNWQKCLTSLLPHCQAFVVHMAQDKPCLPLRVQAFIESCGSAAFSGSATEQSCDASAEGGPQGKPPRGLLSLLTVAPFHEMTVAPQTPAACPVLTSTLRVKEFHAAWDPALWRMQGDVLNGVFPSVRVALLSRLDVLHCLLHGCMERKPAAESAPATKQSPPEVFLFAKDLRLHALWAGMTPEDISTMRPWAYVLLPLQDEIATQTAIDNAWTSLTARLGYKSMSSGLSKTAIKRAVRSMQNLVSVLWYVEPETKSFAASLVDYVDAPAVPQTKVIASLD